MIYTVRNKCDEVPELKYDDGLQFMYFNTRGTKGGSEAIQNMLKYMEQSIDANIVDEATKEVAEYVDKVKRKPEVESGFMTLQDKIDLEKESSYNEGLEQGMQQGLERGIQQGLEHGMQQGLERGIQQGLEQGMQQGLERGMQQTIINLVKDDLLQPSEAAKRLGMSEAEFSKLLK